jgi:hypothetical protein
MLKFKNYLSETIHFAHTDNLFLISHLIVYWNNRSAIPKNTLLLPWHIVIRKLQYLWKNIFSLRNSLIFRWVCIKRGAMSQDSLIKMPFPCVHVVCDQEHRVPRHIWGHGFVKVGDTDLINFSLLFFCSLISNNKDVYIRSW